MIETLKRWIKNIKWLLDRPPTSLIERAPVGAECDYCGTKTQLFNYEGYFCICKDCMKIAFDTILKGANYKGRVVKP